MLNRPVLYDITHLSARFWTDSPSGIDRVDLLFAKGLSSLASGAPSGVHQSRVGASRVSALRVAALIRRLERRWQENLSSAEDDPLYAATTAWIAGESAVATAGAHRHANARATFQRAIRAHFFYRQSFTAMIGALKGAAPGSLYLNASQWGLGAPEGLAWLARRPDVKPVFFVHDTLPLDYPEYFQPEIAEPFRNLPANLARHAAGIIVSTSDVAGRLKAHLARHGRPNIPIAIAPLPPFQANGPVRVIPKLAGTPYFVALGTIEPRKNHLMLLNLWRDMARAADKGSKPPPKLVIVGARGWHNRQALDMLERTPGLGRYVLELSGLSSPALHGLLSHAAGLLFPTFAEGFGLPVVEAAAAGTPAVVSDIPVLREVAGHDVLFRHPLDGPGWQTAIEELAARHGDGAHVAGRIAARPASTSETSFFDRLAPFLVSL